MLETAFGKKIIDFPELEEDIPLHELSKAFESIINVTGPSFSIKPSYEQQNTCLYRNILRKPFNKPLIKLFSPFRLFSVIKGRSSSLLNTTCKCKL